MPKNSVVALTEILEHYLQRTTKRSQSLSVMCQLLIALRFLATGCFQLTNGDLVGCHQSTVSRNLPKILEVIASLGNLANVIRMPESEIEIRETKSRFYKIGGFPAVIGTIDCTHVRIQSPDANFGEQYRNRKGYFSLNVQVVGNADLKVLDIEARWPGSVHDQTILDASFLKVRFERNDFDKSVLLGDGGYALKKYLLTPLTNPQNYAEKSIKKHKLKHGMLWKDYLGFLNAAFQH